MKCHWLHTTVSLLRTDPKGLVLMLRENLAPPQPPSDQLSFFEATSADQGCLDSWNQRTAHHAHHASISG